MWAKNLLIIYMKNHVRVVLLVYLPLSHFELYWAVRRGGMPPRLRYMTGSRPEKSMTVAAYSSPLSVTTAVELWRGSYGQRATPFTRSSTLLMLPTCDARKERELSRLSPQRLTDFLKNDTHKYTLIRTSLVIHSGWKAFVPQVMTSVLFTSRTLM